jgi:hypothetical protein
MCKKKRKKERKKRERGMRRWRGLKLDPLSILCTYFFTYSVAPVMAVPPKGKGTRGKK